MTDMDRRTFLASFLGLFGIGSIVDQTLSPPAGVPAIHLYSGEQVRELAIALVEYQREDRRS